MLTSQQNLEEAGKLLDKAAASLSTSTSHAPADLISLAVARISLAQALHMIKLAENVNDALEGSRRYGLDGIESPDYR